MRKFKLNPLILANFILAITLCLSISLAKADNTNDTNVNERVVNTNENRNSNDNSNINDNQPNLIGTRDNVNTDQVNVNEINDNVNKTESSDASFNGTEHRSAVATFVQNLLNIANREQGGIGDQVKAIAQAQNETKDKESEAIDTIKNRGKVKTFLIGTDYKNIGVLRSEMVKTQNQINQLTNLLSKTTSADNKTALTAQINGLTAEQLKINNFITTNESKFSLLGWLVKLFNK